MAITKHSILSPTLDEGEWNLVRINAVDAAATQCATLLESFIGTPLREDTLTKMEAIIRPMFIYCINQNLFLDPEIQYINVSVSKENPNKVIMSPSPQLVAWMKTL